MAFKHKNKYIHTEGRQKPSSQDMKDRNEKAIAVPGRERIINQWVPQNQIYKSLDLERKRKCEILHSVN